MSILPTHDGSPTLFSDRFGAAYHSLHGAVTESQHVFIEAGLCYKGSGQRKISVLETGFGTGLNAFMTMLEAERRNLKVAYTGLELYPVETELAEKLDYAEALGVSDRSREFLALHSLAWGEIHPLSIHFSFQKLQISIPDFRSDAVFDVVYFDAFAPQSQPELWTEAVFANLYAALRPAGVLVTYCAQGAFKRTLKHVGFRVERLPGPPGKREMTRGTK